MNSPDRLVVLKPLLLPILEQVPVQFSLLSGSASRGSAFRDLDIAIMPQPGYGGLREMLALGSRLEKATGVPLDLVTLTEATVAFQYEVSKGVLLTSQDEAAYYDWRERTWANYFEVSHFLRAHALAYARFHSGLAE